jgi:hypothetical protein
MTEIPSSRAAVPYRVMRSWLVPVEQPELTDPAQLDQDATWTAQREPEAGS